MNRLVGKCTCCLHCSFDSYYDYLGRLIVYCTKMSSGMNADIERYCVYIKRNDNNELKDETNE